MKRTLAADVSKNVGQAISIQGWLHKKRLLGGLTFIVIRDRSGIVQCVVQDKEEVEKLRGLQLGTVLKVTGQSEAEQRAPGGAEIHRPKVEVLVPVTDESPVEIDKPLSHKSENLDTLFDTRVIGLRNLQEQTIFKIRERVICDIRNFLQQHDFTEIQSPKIVAGAAEGGSEVFVLDYFGKDASLAQSPQLYKQIMVGVFERVFEIGPAFRAELSATTRHVSEVTMLDIEMGFIDGHDDVLNLVQDMVYSVLSQVYDQCQAGLKSLKAPGLILKKKFPRYSVAQVHDLYSKATKQDTRAEKDLTPDEEKWICEYARQQDGCEAVFVTAFSKAVHKFYQMLDPATDGQTVLTADLLFRGVEIATCPMREHRYDILLAQMKDKGIDPTHPGFSNYLLAFKHGLPPHGGCGFGIDRFVEKIIGLNNIKEAILFPRDINRITP